MNGNNGPKAPIPFPVQAGVPLVGMPFTLETAFVPVHLTLRCNCGGVETAVSVVASAPGTCPSCRKVYNAAFNPATNKLEIRIGVPNV